LTSGAGNEPSEIAAMPPNAEYMIDPITTTIRRTTAPTP
jgi:hypothetical protein